MYRISRTIAPEGPLIEVVVAVGGEQSQEFQKLGIPIPSPRRVLALLDTGADGTAIHPDLVDYLRLRGTGIVEVTGQNGTGHSFTFVAGLSFIHDSGQTGFRDVLVAAGVCFRPGVFALIGRNLLDYCVLHYDGRKKTFTLDC